MTLPGNLLCPDTGANQRETGRLLLLDAILRHGAIDRPSGLLFCSALGKRLPATFREIRGVDG